MVDTFDFGKFIYDIVTGNYEDSSGNILSHKYKEAEVLSKKGDGNIEFNEKVSNQDSPSEKDKEQEQNNVDVDEYDDIHIEHILDNTTKSLSRPQDKDTQVKNKEVVDEEI